jgi:hypothetical protein
MQLLENVIEKSGKSGIVVNMVLDGTSIVVPQNSTRSTVMTPRDQKTNAMIHLEGNEL